MRLEFCDEWSTCRGQADTYEDYDEAYFFYNGHDLILYLLNSLE